MPDSHAAHTAKSQEDRRCGTCDWFVFGHRSYCGWGKYVHSGWDGEIDYARYRWRGREWIIPTAPVYEEPSK